MKRRFANCYSSLCRIPVLPHTCGANAKPWQACIGPSFLLNSGGQDAHGSEANPSTLLVQASWAGRAAGVPAPSLLWSIGAAQPYTTMLSSMWRASSSPGSAEAGWHGYEARWKAGGLREGPRQLLLRGWPHSPSRCTQGHSHDLASPWIVLACLGVIPTLVRVVWAPLQAPLAPQRDSELVACRTSYTGGMVEQDREKAAPRCLVCPAPPNNSTLLAGLLHETCRFLQTSSVTTTRVRASISVLAATNPYEKIPWGEAGNLNSS